MREVGERALTSQQNTFRSSIRVAMESILLLPFLMSCVSAFVEFMLSVWRSNNSDVSELHFLSAQILPSFSMPRRRSSKFSKTPARFWSF